MKPKKIRLILSVPAIIIFMEYSYSFEKTHTHPSISQEAVDNSQAQIYSQNQFGYAEGLSEQLQITDTSTMFIQDLIENGMDQSITTRSIIGWIREGSKLEDAKVWQARSQHHFYDPIRNTGLDNRTDHPDWEGFPTIFSPFDLRGESALFWIATGTSSTGYPKNNQATWSATRDKFYSALTSNAGTDREQYMAETFIALGHILHMLEDMGVPAHTRNDFLFGHYRSGYTRNWGNPFEGWVEKQIENNGGQCPWSGTGPVVFDKLAKYFDAEMYSGDYLGDGIQPPDTWGLAECTNYQFLSLSTIFRTDGSLYEFPQPSREHVQADLLLFVPGGSKRYFNGSNYGVTYIARESYTQYKAKLWGYENTVFDKTNTTNDEIVFQYYADITIPRTIDYTVGLVNYFFRGRLSVEPNWVDPNIVELVITNDSNNSGVPQYLKGGTFELYRDDRDGNRAELADFTVEDWEPESVLNYGETLTATFTREADAAAYTLVYTGQISQNPSAPDLEDPNAIAVVVFRPGYPVIAWGRDDYGQVSDVPDGNNFIAVAAGKRHCLALKVDGSVLGWGYNEHGECNAPNDTDFTAISAGIYHSVALKSNSSIIVWGRDNLNQITDKPDGNDFVAIAAGDYHSLALKTDGTIVGWGGWNTYGECDAPNPDTGTVYIDISAGRYHSLGLQSDGKVKAWGSNNQGQTRIYAGGATRIHEAVAAGDNYSFLLRDDDMLISWGGGDFVEPGLPDYHYRQPDGNDFVAITAGTDHIMALACDGKVFDWDWPVGGFPFDYFARAVPTDVVFTEDIGAGYDFSVALKLP